MEFNLFLIALTVQKLLRFYYENYLSGSTFECESGATNVKDEPTILSWVWTRALLNASSIVLLVYSLLIRLTRRSRRRSFNLLQSVISLTYISKGLAIYNAIVLQVKG